MELLGNPLTEDESLRYNMGLMILILFIISFSLITCDNENRGNNDAPIITSLEFVMAPNANTPLAGLLELNTNKRTRVSLFVSDGSNSSEIDSDELNQFHSLPVLGFRPDRTYTIQVKVVDQRGNEAFSNNDIEVTTDPLPEDFPDLNVVSTPEKMEPGITIFPTNPYIIAVDEFGDVVWYHRIEENAFLDRDIRRLSNGNLLILLPRLKIIEIDMLGNELHKWHPSLATEGDEGSIPVSTRAFHHGVFEMESGNILVLSVELRQVEDFPSSQDDPFAPTETANVVGDVVVEFSPDGTIVKEWPLLDLLDPRRIGYDSLLNLYDAFFNLSTRDWSHANAVVHDPSDDSIILSLRHQDAVIKFSRKTGELIWILGNHDNWNPIEFGDFLLTPTVKDEFFWQFHQHGAMVTKEDSILMFDNGNFRASSFNEPIPDEENFSRAVEYSVNEVTKEISPLWEYGQFIDPRLFANFLGDADSLPMTGNVLITFGGMLPARIIEVTHTTPGERVFELTSSTFIYESKRFPSLYP